MISPDVFMLLIMTLCGVGAAFFFDLLRAFRIRLRPPTVIVALSDILFCFISTFAAVALVWNFNGGRFRLYEPAGLVLGAVLYFLALSRHILRALLFLLDKFLKLGQLIFKILLTPSRFLYKILVVPIPKFIRRIRRGSGKTNVK